jgi:hypothetical protein
LGTRPRVFNKQQPNNYYYHNHDRNHNITTTTNNTKTTKPTTMSTSNPSLPTPPFHLIPNINNLRDAATSLTTPTGPLRRALLFRSAEVSKLSHQDWLALHSLGIGHVFDLRSKAEVERGWAGIVGKGGNGEDDDVRPGWLRAMQDAGVQRSWVPVFADKDYSPERLAERYAKYMDRSVAGFVAAYRDILRDGGDAYRAIFLYLAGLQQEEGEKKVGALVHCTAGKDRTGIFFGILFDFLGVSRSAIAEEYNLTELGLSSVREEVVARLLLSPGFKKYMLSLATGKQLSKEEMAKLLEERDVDDGQELDVPPEVKEEGRQAALRMVGARKESMIATLEMMDREFGGSEKYMREVCGLNDNDLEKLKRVLISKK